MRHNRGSLIRAPAIWILYGRPSDENPDGTQIDGVPARFIGDVNSSERGNAFCHALFIAFIPPIWRSCVTGHAGDPPAGQTMASTEARTRMNCSLNFFRISRAASTCAGVHDLPASRKSRI